MEDIGMRSSSNQHDNHVVPQILFQALFFSITECFNCIDILSFRVIQISIYENQWWSPEIMSKIVSPKKIDVTRKWFDYVKVSNTKLTSGHLQKTTIKKNWSFKKILTIFGLNC